MLGMEPARALGSEAGSGALSLLLGTASLLASALLINTLYRLKCLEKRGRESSDSHSSEEFLLFISTKLNCSEFSGKNCTLLKRE